MSVFRHIIDFLDRIYRHYVIGFVDLHLPVRDLNAPNILFYLSGLHQFPLFIMIEPGQWIRTGTIFIQCDQNLFPIRAECEDRIAHILRINLRRLTVYFQYCISQVIAIHFT